ncbi:MAG: glycosyltransferase family 2 protein [Candidatus Hodarchaeales archaeon]|jgi:glycosyltransferase involved in cell wall biosynthesis
MVTKYSIVIPTYNEAGNIFPLFEEINDVMKELKHPWEVIFVNDGSTDDTGKEITELCRNNQEAKLIHLRKNFGQSSAMNAGFNHTNGEIVITLDADRQNDPNDIPKLLTKLEEGYDVVSGWRHNRKDSIFKKIPSKIQNWLHRRLTGLKIHDSGCSLKVYKKEALESVIIYGEMHRYIPALVNKLGYKVGEVKTNHRKRTVGRTKYGIKRIARGFFDIIYLKFWLSYSSKPMHLFGWLSFLSFLSAVSLLGFNLYRYGYSLEAGPLLLLSALLAMISMQFLVFGILSELVMKIFYSDPKNKPYSIDLNKSNIKNQ